MIPCDCSLPGPELTSLIHDLNIDGNHRLANVIQDLIDSKKSTDSITRIFTPAPVAVPTFDEWLEIRGKRLPMYVFIAMRNAAEPWLRTAMDLALQTTHARLGVLRIEYSIREPKNGACGCVWLDEPENGIYGTFYIHRQKVQKKEASYVAIPIGEELKRIIDNSRDSVASPYVVHWIPERNNKRGKEVTQVTPDYLSRSFYALRDKHGLCVHLPMEEHPAFHEIRVLAAHLFDSQGIDSQGRMAHSDAKSTKIYTSNHIDWVMVPHGEIKTGRKHYFFLFQQRTSLTVP